MSKRRWIEYRSDRFRGLISDPAEPTANEKSLLILLHGVGSNEEALLEDGEAIFPHGEILSLRGPIKLGRIAFAYFRVSFTDSAPVHQWEEALATLNLLSEEIKWLSETKQIPLQKIFLMGFSQGAIMTLGELLQGPLKLGGYLAFAGRTLPEFANYARLHPHGSEGRAVFLAHGRQDTTLAVHLGHATRDLLIDLNLKLTYEEYDHGHGIPVTILPIAKTWIAEKL